MEKMEKVTSDQLARLDFCADLSQEHCAILASLATPVEFEFDQLVFRCGDSADACYLVQQGLVALEICAPGTGCRRIGTAGPGELIGWSPFLPDSCFSATARALEKSRVLRIPSPELRMACDQNPEFGYQILKGVVRVLAARISASRMQMLDLFGPEHSSISDFPETVLPMGDGNGNR